jgi:hypothetical protein
MRVSFETLLAGLVAGLVVAMQVHPDARRASGADRTVAPQPPRLLSETGLYAAGKPFEIDPRNRPFSPQYPLWSDGAHKRRWVFLPAEATIDATHVDDWVFPVDTRFWKEFELNGQKVETRFLWKATESDWVFASYVWDEAQRDAVLAPEEGLPGVAEVAPGRRHSIPSRLDCRACHDSARTEILGFNALQLSTDRDPNAIHGEPLRPGMVTLRTLVDEQVLRPQRADLLTDPPRIPADNPRTRAVLGYLSANCGACHNAESSITSSVGMRLKQPARQPDRHMNAALATIVGRPATWTMPGAAHGASELVVPGAPGLSALVYRMKSRRPSSQMPPLGTVVSDDKAVELVTRWINEDLAAAPIAAMDEE